MSTELSTWLHRSGYLSRETRGRGARLSKSTVTLSIPGRLDRPDVDDGLGGLGHGRNLPPVHDAHQHREHDYDGHAHDCSRRAWDETHRAALGMPELFADAALELEYLDSLLLVLSGAARGLFGVNMGAITADWPEDGKSSAGFTKSNFDST